MNPICVEVDHISPTVVLIIIIIMVIISNIDCCCPRTHPTNPPCAILLSCGSSCSYALLLHTVYINRNIYCCLRLCRRRCPFYIRYYYPQFPVENTLTQINHTLTKIPPSQQLNARQYAKETKSYRTFGQMEKRTRKAHLNFGAGKWLNCPIE